jgi:hypothetical protein
LFLGFQTSLCAEQFPYKAQITGNNVNVRSGPGTNYYRCSKLKDGDIVTVVAEQFNWSRIMPLEDSFCWISKQYIKVNPQNIKEGTVTGDSVRVWAGSEFLRPIHSTRLQMKLNEGDKVQLLGEQADGYYKIAAPTGTYFWVSSDYVKPYQPPKTPVETPNEPAEANEPVETVVQPAENPKPVELSKPAEKKSLEKFEQLEKRITEERKKPLEKQDYSEIKTELKELMNDPNAGKAGQYAKFVLKRLQRVELALNADDALESQQKQLEKATSRIEQAKRKKLSKIGDIGKFAVIGKLAKSNLYEKDPKNTYYKVLGADGNILCYALACEGVRINVDKFISKKVGLVGEIEAHPSTKQALVKFKEIQVLN